MSHRFLFIAGALIVSASGCAKSSETRLKNADEAAASAQEKKIASDEAQNEAREAENDARKESTAAAKSVHKERAKVREKLEEEIADANAKLAAPMDKGQPSDQQRVRLEEKRNVLKGHLTTVGEGAEKEWPAKKQRIDADLERFDD